jgi:polysaccharide export outer membrane protein
VPAAVLPGPAPGGPEPYTLDSGDRLRIVVFGQGGLTSTYIVDVSGKIAMPLIGAISVRGLTTTQAARAIADRLRQATSASRTWRSRSRSTGRSSSSAR